MEGKTQFDSSSSSSSFTSELFGSNQSQLPSSSSGILASLFPPSSKVLGRESRRFQVTEKTATSKTVIPDDTNNYKGNDGETHNNTKNKDMMSSIYEEQRVQPCHLSSSIYYGGQDIYSLPQGVQNSGLYKKDGGEDDSGSASRGNWWQGIYEDDLYPFYFFSYRYMWKNLCQLASSV
ncbi:hypothetical protein PIB30_040632 [Stylosanthes scabra]|uniref:Uncharacterized protein n=1 Tax=Stylosanthes scabra TaxID=79078 RepID=A0ABU6VCX0_9FABA|nr:hypothetical protein [Stylosanthes scabra]